MGYDTMKNKSSRRTMPLIPAMEKILLEHKAKQEEYMKLFGNSYSKEYQDYVCVDPLGNRDEPALRTVLASYYVLPALVEVLCFMKDGVSEDDEDIKTRAWYVSITNRLRSLKTNLEEQVSMTTVANKILTDIVQETMNGLKHIKDNVLTGGNTEG